MKKSYAEITFAPSPWLESLPSHWKCKKIGFLFSERKTKVSDKDYPPLSVTKIGIVPQLATAAKTEDGDSRKLVCTGDFVINSRSDRKGSCGVSELDGSVSLINIVLTPRNEWNRRYVHYLMRSHSFSEEYYRNGKGIVADLWTTRFSEMKSIFLPIPTRAEQNQIVCFLDWKVSSINKLINLKRKEISLLEEKRKVLITYVTHYGLNASCVQKASGFSCIGQIPRHWHLRAFRKVAKVCTNLVSPSDYFDYNHISPSSIEKNSGRIIHEQTVREAGVVSNNHLFKKGQIIYSKVRPLLNKVVIAPYDGLCSADMYPIETTLEIRYLKYYMLSQNFLGQLSMTGNRVKMPKINQDELSSVLIAFPDRSEQIEIADYLDRSCENYQRIIENIKKYVTSLQELKMRLIDDVVTGKTDVRDVEIPEYELMAEETADDVDSFANNDESFEDD